MALATLTARPVVRYIFLVFVVIIALHSILSLTHSGYSQATSLSHLLGSSQARPTVPADYYEDIVPAYLNSSNNNNGHLLTRKANATMLMLARNSDIDGAVRSVREVEDRFNRKFGYPWVFLNEEDFSEEFKKRISVITTTPVSFGRIPHDHWFQPSWIDEGKASAGRKKMEDDGVIYGGSLSYRNMCRFNSGFFYRHELLQPYRYYWRVEPDVHFHCEVDFDPFLFMGDYNKTYGFTITMYEFEKTIPTLWDTVKAFVKEHPQYVSPENAMAFLSEDGGERYNLCHFWSNFEIADMDFWRGEAYTKFFEYLDKTGGFYYERWGDAPVHSIAAGLLSRKDQIHFFSEIGYEHNPYTHCPTGEAWTRGRCSCNEGRSFDYDGYSCMAKWDRVNGIVH
ncbi:glycosyltransferase family 15 protein [Neolentinus lepideus HHB14362 ss-1]|uniref:Glycosyltransferase family 15 protein n=1 Tax=Neolentinus lepideus HHB14362 ss-1 TaxID=1314782 RepID=A0A165QRB1_9AGAM|nr:glycosyltransferase family 15 protein [Neolentinus lepideus HHB14362 ss-1]